MALNTTARKQAVASTQNRKASTSGSGFFCYIGPTIRGLIQSGTIYIGTREKAFQDAAKAIQERPLIKTLIVPGERLAVDRLDVKKPGTALYQNYQHVARGK